MLDIRIIMNSAVEEIFAFKTCCGSQVFDQNLEIQVFNRGKKPVTMKSCLDLEGEFGVHRVDTLMPQGEQLVDPGTVTAFYCYMDEALWKRSRRMIFHDDTGNAYPVVLHHETE